MEKQPIFVLKLSLEEMALRRVVINLWNESSLLYTNQNFQIKPVEESSYYDKERWRDILEGRVKVKVSNLVLPDTLKKLLIHLVRPIGYQMLRWKIFYEDFGILNVDLGEELCWTSAGAIDNRKTVEKIVRMEMFDVATRFKLACTYCLDDYLPVIWKEAPKDFYLKNNKPGVLSLEIYWAYVLQRDKSLLDSLTSDKYERFSSRHQCAFLVSACAGKKSATEYFFQQLTSEERNPSLRRAVLHILAKGIDFSPEPYAFIYRNFSEVLCYLLTVMSPEQQIYILKTYPSKVLRCFLEWPKQDLFLDIANLIGTLLPKNDYKNMVLEITPDIVAAGRYFPNLIQKFLLLSPSEFRRHFACSLCRYFPSFLYDEDTETIKAFFRIVDPKSRTRLVLESRFLHLLGDYILKGEWNFVEVSIREASLSKENKEKMKEAFLHNFRPRCRHQDQTVCKKLTRFFDLLEETEINARDGENLPV